MGEGVRGHIGCVLGAVCASASGPIAKRKEAVTEERASLLPSLRRSDMACTTVRG